MLLLIIQFINSLKSICCSITELIMFCKRFWEWHWYRTLVALVEICFYYPSLRYSFLKVDIKYFIYLHVKCKISHQISAKSSALPSRPPPELLDLWNTKSQETGIQLLHCVISSKLYFYLLHSTQGTCTYVNIRSVCQIGLKKVWFNL